jgi:hypothetical protein
MDYRDKRNESLGARDNLAQQPHPLVMDSPSVELAEGNFARAALSSSCFFQA